MNSLKQDFIQSVKIIILALLIAVGTSYVSAVTTWTAPSTTPPNGNVDAPVNVGYTGQIKQGNLWIKGLVNSSTSAVNGLIVENGKVGIGTTAPTQKLDVTGQIHATGDICTDAGGGKCLSTVGGVQGNTSCFYVCGNSSVCNTSGAGTTPWGAGLYYCPGNSVEKGVVINVNGVVGVYCCY